MAGAALSDFGYDRSAQQEKLLSDLVCEILKQQVLSCLIIMTGFQSNDFGSPGVLSCATHAESPGTAGTLFKRI